MRALAGLLIAALAVSANAQRGGGARAGFSGGSHTAHFAESNSGIFRSSNSAFRAERFRRSPWLYGGYPFLWDDSYDGSSAPPEVYLLPGPANNAEASRLAPPSPPADPLLIELRGDQYVRVSSTGQSASANSTLSPAIAGPVAATQTAESRPPTVFVFRDGHQEESSDYSIYGGVIYARSDMWTDGSWTKQIPLSSLNIAESRKVNDERGVKFMLPQSPNEVVTRP